MFDEGTSCDAGVASVTFLVDFDIFVINRSKKLLIKNIVGGVV